ncbi:nuclear pore complex protein Nup85 [Pelomyxa schiedti]|nr:nuclear pore complex protein Nup85 [Pelomyxa schiedti]
MFSPQLSDKIISRLLLSKGYKNWVEYRAKIAPSEILCISQKMYLKPIKPVICEAAMGFLELQHKIATKQGEMKTLVCHASRVYRALISAAKLRFTEALAEASADPAPHLGQHSTVLYEQEITNYKYAEILWGLADVMFFQPQPEVSPVDSKAKPKLDYVLPHFLLWFKNNFPGARLSDIPPTGSVEAHTAYKPVLFKSLLQGDMKAVSSLLKRHSRFKSSPLLQEIERLVNTMPLDPMTCDKSVHDSWRKSCSRVKCPVTEDPVISRLLSILMGNLEALEEESETWIDLILAKLIFSNPYTTRQALREMLPKGDNFEPENTVFVNIIRMDASAVLYTGHLIFPIWVIAHMADLFYHCNLIPPKEKGGVVVNCRQQYLLDFCLSCCGDASLFPLALSYLPCILDDTTAVGSYIQLLADQCHPQTENEGFALLSLCQRFKSNDTHIKRVMSRTMAETGNAGASFAWASSITSPQGHPSQLLIQMVSEMIAKFPDDLALDSQQDHSLHSAADAISSLTTADTTLNFIAQYSQLRKAHKSNDYKMHSKVLLSMFKSNIVPDRFAFALLKEAIPHLTARPSVYGQEETQVLMQSILTIQPTLSIVNAKQLEEMWMCLGNNMASAISQSIESTL